MLARLERYALAHGHAKVPARYSADPALGKWVLAQRSAFKGGTLSRERRAALERLGFAWSASGARRDDVWESRFRELCAYKQRHGHLLIDFHQPRATPFEVWVLKQRRLYKDGRLDAARRRKLEAIGFVWDQFEAKWLLMRAQLAAWRARHGRFPTQTRRRTALTVWCQNQRAARRQKRLSKARIASLDALGFVWEPRRDVPAEDRVRELRAFRRRFGHLAVPFAGNSGLVQWMAHKRLLHERGTLDRRLERELDALGFPWTPEERTWEWCFARAKELKQRTGRLDVPPRGVLARWIAEQRRRVARDELELDRLARLNPLGLP